jgi:hypothetical protein
MNRKLNSKVFYYSLKKINDVKEKDLNELLLNDDSVSAMYIAKPFGSRDFQFIATNKGNFYSRGKGLPKPGLFKDKSFKNLGNYWMLKQGEHIVDINCHENTTTIMVLTNKNRILIKYTDEKMQKKALKIYKDNIVGDNIIELKKVGKEKVDFIMLGNHNFSYTIGNNIFINLPFANYSIGKEFKKYNLNEYSISKSVKKVLGVDADSIYFLDSKMNFSALSLDEIRSPFLDDLSSKKDDQKTKKYINDSLKEFSINLSKYVKSNVLHTSSNFSYIDKMIVINNSLIVIDELEDKISEKIKSYELSFLAKDEKVELVFGTFNYLFKTTKGRLIEMNKTKDFDLIHQKLINAKLGKVFFYHKTGYLEIIE